jgi:sugar lactone lactonase YvrE
MAHFASVTSIPRVLLDDLVFPEAPRWRDDRLWVSDQHAREIFTVDLAGHRQQVLDVPGQPSGLGWLPDGRLLAVSMVDRKVLRLEAGEPAPVLHADLSKLAPHHCNDMLVDAKGRAYVGNFGFDLDGREAPRPTCLVLVAPDGESRVVADELMFPNGMVTTPDGSTLVVGESFGGRLTAFDVATDGSLSNRRVWAELGFPPDGICLDAEGCIWVAVPVRQGAFVRVAEGGEVKQRIDVDRGAYACMLGGPDGRSLFLLEATTSHGEKARARGRGNGRIRVMEVDVPRAGLP